MRVTCGQTRGQKAGYNGLGSSDFRHLQPDSANDNPVLNYWRPEPRGTLNVDGPSTCGLLSFGTGCTTGTHTTVQEITSCITRQWMRVRVKRACDIVKGIGCSSDSISEFSQSGVDDPTDRDIKNLRC